MNHRNRLRGRVQGATDLQYIRANAARADNGEFAARWKRSAFDRVIGRRHRVGKQSRKHGIQVIDGYEPVGSPDNLVG